jgi:hypothetical protein
MEVSIVLISSMSTLLQLSDILVFLGTYSGARCAAFAIRNRDDALNSLFGGGIAGAAVKLHTRDPRAIFASSAVTGVGALIFDLFFGRHS